jgi:preprotein translocase subunit SecF
MRLRLVRKHTTVDFFKSWKIWIGISAVLVVLSIVSTLTMGLNFGIDFKGGTTIRAESSTAVDIADYRAALEPLGLGDISIAEVFDPSFRDDQYVAQIRIQAQEGQESIASDIVLRVEAALQGVAPGISFPSVESVGPKVSGELIQSAALAALLTIVGYSLNDTVVVFDRVRENLRRYKKKDLTEVLNLSINETLSRTVMTSVTTLLALVSLFILGGDVIRGFVFAMIWGVLVGTYSSVFVASSTLLRLGVKRDWSKPSNTDGNQFANIDA